MNRREFLGLGVAGLIALPRVGFTKSRVANIVCDLPKTAKLGHFIDSAYYPQLLNGEELLGDFKHWRKYHWVNGTTTTVMYRKGLVFIPKETGLCYYNSRACRYDPYCGYRCLVQKKIAGSKEIDLRTEDDLFLWIKK